MKHAKGARYSHRSEYCVLHLSARRSQIDLRVLSLTSQPNLQLVSGRICITGQENIRVTPGFAHSLHTVHCQQAGGVARVKNLRGFPQKGSIAV